MLASWFLSIHISFLSVSLFQAPEDSQIQKAIDVFTKHQQELSQVGVYTLDGFVFSAVSAPKPKPGLHEFVVQQATLALIDDRINKQLGFGLPAATALEQAFYKIEILAI